MRIYNQWDYSKVKTKDTCYLFLCCSTISIIKYAIEINFTLTHVLIKCENFYQLDYNWWQQLYYFNVINYLNFLNLNKLATFSVTKLDLYLLQYLFCFDKRSVGHSEKIWGFSPKDGSVSPLSQTHVATHILPSDSVDHLLVEHDLFTVKLNLNDEYLLDSQLGKKKPKPHHLPRKQVFHIMTEICDNGFWYK